MTPAKNILVVALDNIGDAVMASAVLPVLRQQCPSGKIGIWIKRYVRDLFSQGNLIDYVHAADPFWDKSPGQNKGQILPFVRTLLNIRSIHYDMAFILNTEWRRSLACQLAGIPHRVGYSRRHSTPFLTKALAVAHMGSHFIDDHTALLKVWFGDAIDNSDITPSITISPKFHEAGEKWLAQQKWQNAPLLVFHPFSGNPRRCWSVDRWALFISRFSQAHPDIRIVGLCHEAEKSRMELIAKKGGELLRVLTGVDLGLSAAIIGKAKIFIGGDSGPGHIAAAMGIPMLSLFGDNPWVRCRPWGRSPIRLVTDVPLIELSVDRVMNEIQTLL